MPFIPHTNEDVSLMLKELKINSTSELFKEIPQNLQVSDVNFKTVGASLCEMDVARLAAW